MWTKAKDGWEVTSCKESPVETVAPGGQSGPLLSVHSHLLASISDMKLKKLTVNMLNWQV